MMEGALKFIFTKLRLVVATSMLSTPPMYVGEFIRTFDEPGTNTFEAWDRYPTDPSRYLAL